MAQSNLSFAKVVANPSVYSWSQAYNAGKLFAVLSLETKDDLKEKDYLNVLGKEILDNLEQEFFTLEKKDLESIKQAILETAKKISQDVSCSFVACAFIKNILYIYILGNGKVSLKRDKKLGNLLDSNGQSASSLKASSGFLQDNDIVILQTEQFANIISAQILAESIEDLDSTKAAENLAPIVHEKEEPGASAIIVNYKALDEEEVTESIEETINEISPKQKTLKENEEQFYTPKLARNYAFIGGLRPLLSSFFKKTKLSSNFNLNHPRRVILTIAILIVVVFVGSVIFALKKQQNTKIQAAFQSIYPSAEKKYEVGQGLLGLNQNLARDSFSQAKKILENGKDKLPKNSKEEKQVLSLLSRVNSALSTSSGVTSSKEKQVNLSSSPILMLETKNKGLSFSYDDESLYMLTADGVYSFQKDGTEKKQLIKNGEFWQEGVNVFPYSGNLYVLDKKQGQIIKFVATNDGFSNTNYFSDTNPDFSKAVSMTIDSSIYVLYSNGDVSKFTKGTKNDFSLSGLDKSLSNPTKIFTDINTDNIYVLDNGNSRVVVFDKNGAYKNQYQSSVIKTAKNFDVLETDKKVYILSEGKVYQIDLK